MIRKLLLLSAILTLSLIHATAQTATTTEGQELEIRLTTQQPSIMINEPAFVRFEISNYSAVDLCMTSGGDYRNNIGRPDSFKVTVTKNDGTPVFQPKVTFWGGGLVGCEPIPGHGMMVQTLFLPHWAKFETVGFYNINVQKEIVVNNYQTGARSKIAVNATVQVQVVEDDQVKLGMRIDSLGLAMLNDAGGEANNATLALSYIHDKRAIKYFALALQKFIEPELYSRASRAAHALAIYNDEEAIAALAGAMNSADDMVRGSVAEALRLNKHPKAESLLAKMANDPNRYVRLQVALRLKESTSLESSKLLKKLLTDTDEYVRKAARESLNSRTSPN